MEVWVVMSQLLGSFWEWRGGSFRGHVIPSEPFSSRRGVGENKAIHLKGQQFLWNIEFSTTISESPFKLKHCLQKLFYLGERLKSSLS